MKKLVVFLIFIYLFCSYCLAEVHLPADFIKCDRFDPHLNECLKLAIQDALPKLAKGIPTSGFNTLDPVQIPSITIGEGFGAVHVVQNYKNIHLYNLSQLVVDNVKISTTETELSINISSSSPELTFEANYDFNGNILLLPIVGAGKTMMKMMNGNIELYSNGKTFEKKGKSFVEIKHCSLKIQPKEVQVNFENLFNGNEKLGREMNSMLTENWKEVFEEVKPSYEETFALIIKNYINHIFRKVPYNELFSF